MRSNARLYGFSGWWSTPAPGVVLGVLAIGLLVYLVSTDVFSSSMFASAEKPEPSRAGLVAVPTSPSTIRAYTLVTRDHFWNPQKGEFEFLYLPKESLATLKSQGKAEILQDMGQLIGRVLKHDKRPGYVFTEDDFLPKGTRPGLVAGIPPGRRGMRVDAERVFGLQGLQRGDRFDLVATIPLDPKGGKFGEVGGIYGPQVELQARLSNWEKQATVSVVVLDGMVVEPEGERVMDAAERGLTGASAGRSKPVREVVIAVAPAEVSRLTEALAVEAKLVCVPRSGRPTDQPEMAPPALRPRSPFVEGGGNRESFRMIETIHGSKREMVAAPGRP